MPSTYSAWGPGGRPPCASGTYTTREAGTRSPYVPNGGRGAYVSAQERTGEAESVAIQYLFHSVLRMDVSRDDLKYEMSSG